MAGLFVFEGPDGVGKTTITGAVEIQLKKAGVDCEYLSFPGKEQGTIGAHVYRLHHDLAGYDVTQISPLSLQILHVAAHVDAIERRLLPLLSKGTTVLLDRYWWSTWVYGTVAGIPQSHLEAILSIEKLVWQDIVPSSVFLLKRSQSSSDQRLVDAYESLAKQEADGHPIAIINNDMAVGSVVNEVSRRIMEAA